jgi:hypothetical protein
MFQHAQALVPGPKKASAAIRYKAPLYESAPANDISASNTGCGCRALAGWMVDTEKAE